MQVVLYSIICVLLIVILICSIFIHRLLKSIRWYNAKLNAIVRSEDLIEESYEIIATTMGIEVDQLRQILHEVSRK